MNCDEGHAAIAMIIDKHGNIQTVCAIITGTRVEMIHGDLLLAFLGGIAFAGITAAVLLLGLRMVRPL
jgi:hypothetical protein